MSIRDSIPSLCFGAALVLFAAGFASPAHAGGCSAQPRCTGGCHQRPNEIGGNECTFPTTPPLDTCAGAQPGITCGCANTAGRGGLGACACQ